MRYSCRSTRSVLRSRGRNVLLPGLIVGFGSRLGGCTSGHGVCSLTWLHARSIVATMLFMLSGFVTVYVVRHLLAAN